MRLEFLSEPFEHVIIRDFFNDVEIVQVLNEIKTALEFERLITSKSRKFKNSANSGKGTALLSDRIAFNINDMFRGKSKTHELCNKIFLSPLSDELVQKSKFCNFLKNVNHTGVVIGVYKDGDSYSPHYDSSIISLVGHVWKEGTSFEGGELFFPEYNNYSIKPEFNKFIIFPSYIYHGVNKVVNTSGDLMSTRISITLLTLVVPAPVRIIQLKKDYHANSKRIS